MPMDPAKGGPRSNAMNEYMQILARIIDRQGPEVPPVQRNMSVPAPVSASAPRFVPEPAPVSAAAPMSARARMSAQFHMTAPAYWAPVPGRAQPLPAPAQPWAPQTDWTQTLPAPTQPWISDLACQTNWPAQGTETAFPSSQQPVQNSEPRMFQPPFDPAHTGQNPWMSWQSLQLAVPVQGPRMTAPSLSVPNPWAFDPSMMQASATPLSSMPYQPDFQMNGLQFQQQPYLAPDIWTSFQPGPPLQQGLLMQQGPPLQQGPSLQQCSSFQQGSSLQRAPLLQQGPSLQRGLLPSNPAITLLRESHAPLEASSRAKASKISKPGDKRRKQPVVQGPPAKTIINRAGQTNINRSGQTLINRPVQAIINGPAKTIINQPAKTIVNSPAATFINKGPQDLAKALSGRHPLAQVTFADTIDDGGLGNLDGSPAPKRVEQHGTFMTATCGPTPTVSEPMTATVGRTLTVSEPMAATCVPVPAMLEPVPAVLEPTSTVCKPMPAAVRRMSNAFQPIPAARRLTRTAFKPTAARSLLTLAQQATESVMASGFSEGLPVSEVFSTEHSSGTEDLTSQLGKMPANLGDATCQMSDVSGVVATPEVPQVSGTPPQEQQPTWDSLVAGVIHEHEGSTSNDWLLLETAWTEGLTTGGDSLYRFA